MLISHSIIYILLAKCYKVFIKKGNSKRNKKKKKSNNYTARLFIEANEEYSGEFVSIF